MILSIVISLIFHIYYLVLLIVIFKSGNIFAVIHSVIFVLLVPALQFIRFFDANAEEYVLSYYIATNFLVLFYLVLFAVGLFYLKKYLPENGLIMNSAKSIKDSWLIAAFYGWIFLKCFLFIKYGAGAFSDFKNFSTFGPELRYALWETPIITFISIFSIGASVIYVIKVSSTNGYWKKMNLFIPFILFVIVNTLSHDIAIGPRRFLLILFLVYVFSVAWRDRIFIENHLQTDWKKIILFSILVFGLSGYYQIIRNNFSRPEIVEMISSPNPLDFTRGLINVLVIVPEDQRVQTTASFFREGPFDILYEVVEKLGAGNPGTRGEITYNSLMMVMPRIIVGEMKTDLNADDILASKMGITPPGAFNRPDIATNLPAIFIADFGIIGALATPLLMLFILVLFSASLVNPNMATPILVFFWFSLLVNIAGSVEGDFVVILANLRNGLLLWLICMPLLILFSKKTVLKEIY